MSRHPARRIVRNSLYGQQEDEVTDASQGPPEKQKGAEIIVKRNLGLSIGLFSESALDLHNGIAIFANREGYQFLAEYFRWLAERSIAEK